ncbi:hypothetical protein TRSC58_07283 [Trypanosoma rangeli SC58]|uniref:Uncharacterized protein n=1 Tax=Trypanosoma rangeli SC58 TaxID=429131 RepID=A0A061IT64_TRYRA|nr:hypothetical protein TRSC58_07283 [Trypanosoma rangeli SC58]
MSSEPQPSRAFCESATLPPCPSGSVRRVKGNAEKSVSVALPSSSSVSPCIALLSTRSVRMVGKEQAVKVRMESKDGFVVPRTTAVTCDCLPIVAVT